MSKLIVDSSTKTLYIALVDKDKLVEEMYIEGRNDHAKNIVSKIDEILKKNNINIGELEGIYCGVGPGSYTGVRMAVTVGKMVSTNTNVKLYGFSSLYLIASGYDGKTLPYIDARRGNSFNALYDGMNIVLPEALRPTEDTIKENKDYRPISEDMIKVDPIKVIKSSTICDNPHGFVPNYLRETEAERNLHD
ncbi:MAG: tRNA (adenosine(37)-N6)-threonylcarbamoyltransferase complex dimerization subunit type 1 TsaB [Acholeplasmatales bacterium]|nr:tRNA (adenosine(37)-N6)-threonylcarbamoyltransferase complex dimerization subunit type 1 TsaB [Acholeplasmatales bacterium]